MSSTSLFPLPSFPPSKISPARFPSPGPSAVNVLSQVLRENHIKYHVFFNERRFHNHAAHRALALYALGADAAVLQAGFDKDREYQRLAFKSPGPITSQNYEEHLGDETYYNAYLMFFKDVVLQDGTSSALEKYIFSSAFNLDAGLKPKMLNRFLSGLLHPMIHVGYGVEFGLPGILAEGLAQTAVHQPACDPLIEAADFTTNLSEALGAVTSEIGSSLLDTTVKGKSTPESHAFTILARILKDTELVNLTDRDQALATTLKQHGPALRKYASEWTLSTEDPVDVERKIEELTWTNVLIYGVGGWKQGRPFNADFFFMHLVTSSLFLPSICAYLSPPSQALLLRHYFAVSVALWVSRGKPSFDIDGFFSATTATPGTHDHNHQVATPYPLPGGPLPTPATGTLPFPESAKAVTPNPWLPLMETTVVHPDEHLPKIQRALAHFATLYGYRGSDAMGGTQFEGTELEGAERLDGTLFLRVAGLTAGRMGRVREGERSESFWDRSGFFDRN